MASARTAPAPSERPWRSMCRTSSAVRVSPTVHPELHRGSLRTRIYESETVRRESNVRVGRLLVLLGAGALAAAPTPALAATHLVHPGESIQAAVDAASPGDTIVVQPGVYREAVLNQTDNLTLRGGGPGGFTTIVPPHTPKPNACGLGEPAPLAGICVL